MNFFGADVTRLSEQMLPYASVTWLLTTGVVVPSLFVLAVVSEQARFVASGDEPRFMAILWRTLLVCLVLVSYRYLFDKMLWFCQEIGNAVVNYDRWMETIGAFYGSAELNGRVNLLTLNLSALGMWILSCTAMVAESVFNVVRYLFLAALYIVGPLVIGGAVYPPTAMLLKNWFTLAFKVSFWIVIVRVFQAAILQFNVVSLTELSTGGHGAGDTTGMLVGAALINVMLIASMVTAPMFTDMLFSGEGSGMLAGAVLAGAMTAAGRARRAAGAIGSGARVFADGLGSGAGTDGSDAADATAPGAAGTPQGSSDELRGGTAGSPPASFADRLRHAGAAAWDTFRAEMGMGRSPDGRTLLERLGTMARDGAQSGKPPEAPKR